MASILLFWSQTVQLCHWCAEKPALSLIHPWSHPPWNHQSMEMSTMTHEAQTDSQFLPHHLQIQQLAVSLTLTTQPLDSKLTYAPSGNHFQHSQAILHGSPSTSTPVQSQPAHVMQGFFPCQRSRWHRCVLRRKQSRRQWVADMDLLDRLIQENQHEIHSDDMKESYDPPDILPRSTDSVVSDVASLLFPPDLCTYPTHRQTYPALATHHFHPMTTTATTIQCFQIFRKSTRIITNNHLRDHFSPSGTHLSIPGPFGDFCELYTNNCKATTEFENSYGSRYSDNSSIPHVDLYISNHSYRWRWSRLSRVS
jgi:hypothetical protein